MRWEMEVEEVEAVLERIWDLHDKLSDAIHSISRSHFLNSVKSLRNKTAPLFPNPSDDHHQNGFVFVKDFPVEDDDESTAVEEAKSLNAIRTALENLEDQLEFFHTLQTQQRAERDAAIARLEQSRIVLALRLAEHQGKKYKVIEEARAFVGQVRDHSHFISPEILYSSAGTGNGKKYGRSEGLKSNTIVKFLISSFNFAKNSLRLDGVFGNAALFAVSVLALLHVHQEAGRDGYMSEFPHGQEDTIRGRSMTKVYRRPENPTSGGRDQMLDVLSARG